MYLFIFFFGGGGRGVKIPISDKHLQSFHMVPVPLGRSPNINVEQNHSLSGCHMYMYLQGILSLINLSCLTTGYTLTETIM